MKKILCIVFVFIILILDYFAIKYVNNDNDDKLSHITVAEVAHSVFYAPQYVADKLGFFKEVGIDVEFVLTSGADNVMAAVLSGDADIGLSGSEATIYIYNGGEKDYVMTFAGLTQRDGAFLVSRNKIDNFNLNMLKGKTVIGGRVGGMPEMVFEWVLREHGIDPEKDLNIDKSVAFPAMEGSFIGGNGDFVTLFEPNATNVEKNKFGYVVAYIGELGGNVPYTAYNARRSFINDNKGLIDKFSVAINKGLDYVYSHESREIAEILVDYFPDTNINDMEIIVDRYKKGEAWKYNIKIDRDEWIHLQDIMMASNELDNYVDYDKLIYVDNFINYE